MTSKVELAELADLARLIYCGYRESVDAYRCDRDALQMIRENPAMVDHEAGALQNLIGRGNVQGKYDQALADLANAVPKQLPELWPTLRLVGSGTRWHDDPDFDWPAGIAELRQIEAAAIGRPPKSDPAGEETAEPPKQNDTKPDSLSKKEKRWAKEQAIYDEFHAGGWKSQRAYIREKLPARGNGYLSDMFKRVEERKTSEKRENGKSDK